DTLPGFMDYASAFTEEFLRVAGLRCRMDLPAELPKWPMDAELRYNLFLALKEALNNIVKHARATEVRVGLRLENNSFTLFIEDNGQGLKKPGNGEAKANGRAETAIVPPPPPLDLRANASVTGEKPTGAAERTPKSQEAFEDQMGN